MFLVNLEQTSSCKFSIDHKLHSLLLWNLVSFCKNLILLIYSKLKEKTQCQNEVSDFREYQYSHFIFSQFVIVEHNSRKKYGLASVFSVTCVVCGTENVVKTSSEHRSSQRGPPSHEVNSRTVLGCLHTRIGETHLNNLLCTLHIPSMNPVTFKSRENEKPQKICQLSAVEQSGLHCFNDYILPLRDVKIHATRENGLSVRTVRGVSTLFKDNQPVEHCVTWKVTGKFSNPLRENCQACEKQ